MSNVIPKLSLHDLLQNDQPSNNFIVNSMFTTYCCSYITIMFEKTFKTTNE